jgi:integrase
MDRIFVCTLEGLKEVYPQFSSFILNDASIIPHHAPWKAWNVNAVLVTPENDAWIGTSQGLIHLRSDQSCRMTWGEVDLAAAKWVIPGEKMKSGLMHQVPLSTRALEILEAQKGKHDTLVFPGKGGETFSPDTLRVLMRRLGDYRDHDGQRATPHGTCRASFDTWATVCTGTTELVVDLCLAHVNSDKTKAAYMRSDLLEKRRVLMDKWAGHLDTPPAQGNVVTLKQATG